VFATDVREILPSISAPTLVLHSASNPFVSTEHGQYLADQIRGAQYLEVPSVDHAFFLTDDADPWTRPISEFIDAPQPLAPATRSLMTVAFTDIVDSTKTAAELGDAQWRRLLEKHETLARRHVERASGRVVKFTGDGMMATFDGPARAIECLRDLGRRLDEVGLPIRSGVHTGEVELLGDDIGGLGVHIAARVSSKASAGEIFVSSTVRDLVAGSGLEFADQGQEELKGVPGKWQLLSVK
jgi:class 3 adenylate cyclase